MNIITRCILCINKLLKIFYRNDEDDYGAVHVIPLINKTANDGMFNLPAQLMSGALFWAEAGAVRIRPAGTNTNAL